MASCVEKELNALSLVLDQLASARKVLWATPFLEDNALWTLALLQNLALLRQCVSLAAARKSVAQAFAGWAPHVTILLTNAFALLSLLGIHYSFVCLVSFLRVYW